MSPNDRQLAYRQAAVRDATVIDLVIMLYDILARDLQDALAAMSAHDIETRSARLKHGLLALQQLEDAIDTEAGGPVAVGLARLYSGMRGKILQAQLQQNPQLLMEQLNLLLRLRSAWAQVNSSPLPTAVPQAAVSRGREASPAFPLQEASISSWKV